MGSWIILLIIIAIVLIVWWALLRNVKSYKPDFDVHAHEPSAEPAALQPDDLTLIEGVGPKVNQLLNQAGIQTFSQLAATDVERLRQILEDADLRFIDPASWPEQAQLAAQGKRAEMEALQARLKGGREVE
ncbi:MAG: hypothetical protein QME21_12450 [Anaerolineales bacterium]|nr:hypothetical protein [Anaerolineales bacterium]